MQAQELLARPVIIFSRNYLPICRITVKRAVLLLVTGRAEPLLYMESKEKPLLIRSPSMVVAVPKHIRLTINHIQRNWKVPPVNRREVLRRDRHTCQYCGSTQRLTLDHVVPRSKGGKHTWNNVVTACERCNSRKGDRTPQQAGMILRCEPKPPSHPVLAFAAEYWRGHPPS